MKKQLPPRPSLEQLKKQAKAVLKGHKIGEPRILSGIREHHPRFREAADSAVRDSRFTLADAQLVVAVQYGFAKWSALKAHVLSRPDSPEAGEAVNALFLAANRGDLGEVARLLDAHPGIIDERSGQGTRTALHQAAIASREELARLLLERGADPNIRCEGDSATPLHFAAEKEHLGIVRLLIEHGADPVGEGDYHELEVIGWATCFGKGNPEVVDYLIAHGARHNIFSAVVMGDTAAIRGLAAQSRANLERRMDLTNQRRRPLHLAVVRKQPESLAALLDLGANPESLDEGGLTALDQAALSGEREMAKVLLEHGAKIRIPAAVALERTEDLDRLLRRDPDCMRPGRRWGNLIVRAAAQAAGHIIEALIRAGASVDVRDDPKTAIDSTSGFTPLHAAAWHGNREAAAVLLRHGANVRARDERYGGTPAGWAHFAGHAGVRDLILEGPIDPFEAIEMGRAELIPAILERDPAALERPFRDYLGEVARTALPTGSFIEGVNRDGWHTPLSFAVAAGDAEAVRLLLERGADRTVRVPDGRTLRELGAESGNPQVVELLG